MNRAGPSRRVAAGILVATGSALVLIGLGAPRILPLEVVWLALEWPLVAVGALLMLSAGFVGNGVATPIAMGLGVVVGSFLLAIAGAEAGGRLAGFDFRGGEAALKRYPPYYRQPQRPSGTVFYRRHGPEEWTGQPIRTWLAIEGLAVGETYRDEPVVTVRYDAEGFRQEEPMDDWEIAVAGDSFVELGCLAYEDLYTTKLGQMTGLRVRGFGASNTGPFTHLHYLEDHGVAPGLKRAVIVFYEGNDLQDLAGESRALEYFARTGRRGQRTIRRQTSFVGAMYEAWNRPAVPRGPTELTMPVFRFESREGPVEVTLFPAAPHPAELESFVVEAWEEFLRLYRGFGRRHGVEVWLAYMPCKARVFHGVVEPVSVERSDDPGWSPTPLPEWVEETCRRHGIAFLDLTPALRRAVEIERLCPFNPMVESHLNAVGSAIVARELAARFDAGRSGLHSVHGEVPRSANRASGP